MQTSISAEEAKSMRNKTAMPMMWIGLVSFIMMWAGVTSAYVIRQAQGNWLYFDVPPIFYYSTATIVLSSVALIVAQLVMKKDKHMLSAIMLFSAFVLGVVFCVMQYQGFMQLFDQGIYFTGRDSNASGQYFNIIVWLHVAHVIGGMIALLFTSIKALLKRYSSSDSLGIKLTGTYWHFVGILWIYLILFLVFIR